MHNFLCRTFFYVLAFAVLNTAFGSWPDFHAPLPYFTHYGTLMSLWVLVFEAVYHLAKRRKALDRK